MTSDELRLVQQYAAQGSDAAFEALVSRYINLVYSAALRRVGDASLAEEITQVVFIILSRKAASLGPKTVLSGWLYRTALYVAADALRSQRRREHREQEAYMQSISNEPSTEKAWQELSPFLDEGMARLGQTDRDALVLRYFEGRSLDQVGSALGLSEEAAKKRVYRAVEKLRGFFARRGVGSTAAVLAGALSANSVQAAPAGVAAGVVAAASAKGAAAGGSTLALLKGALKVMAWTKAKIAAVTAVGVVLTAGSAAVAVKEVQAARMAGYPDIRGTWQGTLDTPRLKTRVVVKIWKTNGCYRASWGAIDCGFDDVPIENFVYHHPLVGIGGPDELRLNADGTEMSGPMPVMGRNKVPVVLRRTTEPATVIDLAGDEYTPRRGSDLQGYWKGWLETPTGPELVRVKIAEEPAGTFRAQVDKPHQGRNHIPASVVYERPRLKLVLSGPGGSFEGDLNAGKTRLEGRYIRPDKTHSDMVLERLDPTADLQRERERSYSYTDCNEPQGHWKATIKDQGMLIDVYLNIAKTPDGKLWASMDSPSELLMGAEASKVLFSSPNARIEWKRFGSVYRAKLEHSKLTGTFYRSGSEAYPLVFKRSS